MVNRFYFKDHKLSFLFAIISSVVVVLQSMRFWYFYDYSFIIENSYRFLNGSIFYKDFLFPYPPGTFLMQAVLIKIFGLTLYPQIVYCALISFLTYLLCYRILFIYNQDKLLNLFLAFPVSFTGGYGIVSFPFYDPDATFFALLALLILLLAFNNSFPPLLTIFSGILVVIPSFFKQNMGFSFFFVTHFIFILTFLLSPKEVSFKKYLWFLLGSIIAYGLALILIAGYSGVENYIYSTLIVPKRYRMDVNYLTGIYTSLITFRGIIIWLLAITLLMFFYRNYILRISAIIIFLLPFFIIPFFRFLLFQRSYFDQFLSIWPVTIFAASLAFIYSVIKLKETSLFLRLSLLIPIVFVNSSFLSQSYTGSSYGIWPMLSLLLAGIMFIFNNASFKIPVPGIKRLFIINSVAITVSVLIMIIVNDEFRTIYKFGSVEPVQHSSFQSLNGMSNPGEQIPDFDRLLRFSQDSIPGGESIFTIPAEEPFFFASGRKPSYPLYMFDWTFLIYTPDEIVGKIETADIKWMILKTKLQSVWIMNWKNLSPVLDLLKKRYTLYKSLPGYDIYIKNSGKNSF